MSRIRFRWPMTFMRPLGSSSLFSKKFKAVTSTSLGNLMQVRADPKMKKFHMTKEPNHFCLGKYVPAISYKIHKMNQDPQTSTINLKGLAIGDGLTDPIHQMSYGDFLFQTGLGINYYQLKH